MEQLWALAKAQEATRLAVDQLWESAGRSRVHKQLCYKVAYAGQDVFYRLETAVRERAGDSLALCSAAARLYTVANKARLCVEQLGNPSRLGRLTATIFPHPRKNAERILAEQYKALLDALQEWTIAPQVPHTTIGNGSLPNFPTSSIPTRSKSLSRKFLMRNGSFLPHSTSLHRVLSSPVGNPDWVPFQTAPSGELTFTSPQKQREVSRGGGAQPNSPKGPGLSRQPSGMRIGMGQGSDSVSMFTSIGNEEADLLRRLPFRQRSVRPSDGNSVQRLCFMRGAGGESAAVQLMVVLNKQVEVYSAALDSFHSDTPLDIEAQQVTAMTLYEPTIDLITGHRGGTVLVYGRVGAVISASASNLRGGVLSTAAAAAAAAQQAGVPLVIRLSRAAVTALHCVPAIELEAATAAAAAPPPAALMKGTSQIIAAAAMATAGSKATVEENGNGNGLRTGSGASSGPTVSPPPTPEAIASGAIGACTADDVLLFTGDALGRVMAVRYSRVQPEVLATTVFTTARRNPPRNNGNPPSETPNSPEITGLLYRCGCLLVSTATDIYSIRVLSGPQQPNSNLNSAGPGGANGNGNAETEGGAGSRAAAIAPGSPSEVNTELSKAAMAGGHIGGSRNGGGASSPMAPSTAVAPAAQLPPSTSVNLLSPTASALMTRSTIVSAAQIGATPTSPSSSAVTGGGNGTEPIIRRGALSLSTALVDTFSFVDFDSCTALVAIDWPVPGGSHLPPMNSDGSAETTIAGSATQPEGGSLGISASGDGVHGLGTSGVVAGSVGVANGSSIAGGKAVPGVAAGVPPGRTPKLVSARQGPWRMLSSHINGQLLMWDVTGGRLQLICAIGQPGPPIINVFTFPELGTMVELLSTGHLRVGPLPTSSVAPPINPLGNVPVWQFGRACMRAHRSRLTAGAALANCVATGSRAGGVKVWNAADLRAHAARQDVAFLSPWPSITTAASGSSGGGESTGGAICSASEGPNGAPAGGGGRTSAGQLGGRRASSTIPITSGPYPLSDHYALTNVRGNCRNSGDEHFNGTGPISGPSGSSHATGVYATYPSSGGGYPPYSRVPSGHGPSGGGLPPPCSYPFMPEMCVQTSEPFGSSYPLMPQSAGNSMSGCPPGGGTIPLNSPQQAPGAPASRNGEPQAPPQHMAVPMPPQPSPGRGASSVLPVISASPFANVAASADSLDVSAPPPPPQGLSATGVSAGAGGGGASLDPFRHTMPFGGPTHGHGVRSDDSGNLSAVSSAGTNNNFTLHHIQGHRQLQRGTQGLRQAGNGAAQPQQQQHQQQSAGGLARVSERPAGDATPSRTRVPLSETEKAVARIFSSAREGDDALNNKLPTVGPIGYDSGEAETMDTQPDLMSSSKPGNDTGPSTLDSQSAVPMAVPQYPSPYPAQHYPAPPSPVASRAPTPGVGATLLPPTVVAAAQDEYGRSSPMYGVPYPPMPPITTDALPLPPPHVHHHTGPASPLGGLAMHRGLKFADSRMSPVGYHSPQPHTPSLFGNSILGNGGHMMYGRTSDFGVTSAQPNLYSCGVGQHVPGPQMNMGRRNSNLSDIDMMSGRISPFDPQDSGEVGLPPPPPLRPPPVVAPTANQTQDSQLSQNCFIRSEDLRTVEQIGEGAEGIVYRGRWHHIDVAVKEMHPTSASFDHLASIAKDLSNSDPAAANKEVAGLIKEVAALIDLGQHPNIIRFIGLCTFPPRIVTEYYKMGSLYSMLKEARQGNIRTREKLAWDKRLIMLKDIAAGMAYLHSRDYIHGDLRSPNVFVTEDQHLKIGDFGFARILGKAQNHVVPARLTNPRWQAPEVYDMADPIATTAADVYSFGIIMYEMLTFRLPYDEEPEDEIVKVRHTLDPRWRPHMPPDRQLPVQKSIHTEGHLPPLQAYKSLMMDCWAIKPADRPGFHKIATRLNALCHWQWALSVIKRSLHFRTLSRARNGNGSVNGTGGVDASADVTPTSTTPNSVSSPTSSVKAAPIPPQVLNRMLGQVVSTLQQDPAIERQLLDGGLHAEESTRSGASSAAVTVVPPPPALPLLPQLPPLQGASAAAMPQPHQVAAPPLQVPAPRPLTPTATSQQQTSSEASLAVPTKPLSHSQQASAAGPASGSSFGPQLSSGSGTRPGDTANGAAAVSAVTSKGLSADGKPRVSVPSAAAVRPTMTMARPAAVIIPEPELEPVPTLASTGSRPLQVPAATTPRFPPAAATVATAPTATAPPAPPPTLTPQRISAVAGDGMDALTSPFQTMRLSDDEDSLPVGASSSSFENRTAWKGVMPGARVYAAYTAHATATAAKAAAGVVTQDQRNANWMHHHQREAGPVAPAPSIAAPSSPPLCTAGSMGAPLASLMHPGMVSPLATSVAAAMSSPPACSSVASVELPVPPRMMDSPQMVHAPAATPPPALPVVMPRPAVAAMPTLSQRNSAFKPTPPVDPLEMRTAFHMGIGFSIDDDDED